MLRPQLAKEASITSLQAYLTDEDWIMEQKLDGHRLLLCSPGGDMPPSALTRAGTPYTRKLPQALRDFRFPDINGPMDFVLDGELVGDTFYVFDIPQARELVDPSMPLRLRRFMLETSIQFWGAGCDAIRLAPQAKTREQKIALAERAIAENFEGLILKKVNSPYRSGMRTEEWMKVKFKRTVDVIVLDVRGDGKESARLGLVERLASPGVSSSVIEVGRASLIGKDKGGVINVGDVVEVEFLYVPSRENPRLYQPTILRRRTDKAMHECLIEQLEPHYTNKTVLESL